MPTTLWDINLSDKQIIKVTWSDSWNTLTPWTHKGNPTGYISFKRELSESEEVDFTYAYIGPIGIISGRWVG